MAQPAAGAGTSREAPPSHHQGRGTTTYLMYSRFYYCVCVMQTVLELGLEGQPTPSTPKPRISSARVTSALRKSQSKVTSPTPLSPSPSPPPPTHHPPHVLCNTDGIFELLESHQVYTHKASRLVTALSPHSPCTHEHNTQTSLQSVVGTAAAASFTDDLHRWHKQLQTIEAVLGVWLQVQTLWSQLEVSACTHYICTYTCTLYMYTYCTYTTDTVTLTLWYVPKM